jgi:hypothetical protein
MFKSTQRPIIIPQSEHQKLAGALAQLWGNAEFELPPLPQLSVVAGIALHDRAFGYLDSLPVGVEVDDAAWLPMTRAGFYMPCTDPVADLITRHHLLRLVSGRDTPSRRALAEEMRNAIQEQIEHHGLNADLFLQVDRTTRLCDFVAFDFCFEQPSAGQVEVFTHYAKAETEVVRYRIDGSEIILDPWPLQIASYSGYLVGYQLAGYPERLDGCLIPFHIQPFRPGQPG